jgi:hypothetical protein
MSKSKHLKRILVGMVALFCAGLWITPAVLADIYLPVNYWYSRTAPGEGTWNREFDQSTPWGPPEWRFENDVKSLLWIPNSPRPNITKNLYLELEYSILPTAPPVITVSDPVTGVNLVGSGPISNPATKSWTWHWTIFPQPASEIIRFPGWYGYDMLQGMTKMEVATYCIPEPVTAVLLAIAGLALLQRRF